MRTIGIKRTAFLLSAVGALVLASGYASATESASYQHATQGDSQEGKAKECPRQAPAANVVVQDTDDGIALVLTPADPGRLGELRAHVRSSTARLASEGQCMLLIGPAERGAAPVDTSSQEDPFAPWKFGG